MTVGRPASSDTGAPGGVEGPGRRTAAFLALTLALFVALTAVMTYPQVLRSGYSFFPPSYRTLVTAVQGFPDETSMNVITSHGVRHLVIHGEWLFGARYELLVADLDRRQDLKLVSRRPWQRENKHAEISVYRILAPSHASTR